MQHPKRHTLFRRGANTEQRMGGWQLLVHAEIGRRMVNLSNEALAKQAIEAVEQDGIVFIDEIDKICKSRDAR
jgi:ATP-dependent protease HslVU (ClpYQ) ATPase subunit